MIEGLWRDLRFGVRAHARTPIATVAIVATLSMGIAATTASFSITSAFFLRPLPIAEPDRFVRLYRYQAGTNARYFPISSEALREIRALTRVFETAFVEQPRPLIVGAAGSYERLWGERSRTSTSPRSVSVPLSDVSSRPAVDGLPQRSCWAMASGRGCSAAIPGCWTAISASTGGVTA